jgi:2-amino-4-hydroxy-6-hydroxymethyldihydropteridine diphosphokinase
MTRAYLSLGSNLEPQKNLQVALNELRARFGAIVVSPTYYFPAIGFDGPDFLNLAVGIDTDLDPVELSTWLHALEDRHGRRRDVPRYSSRTLDIDVVLYGDLVMRGAAHLELPRSELKHAFVLKPLAEIAPRVLHPVSGITLEALWHAHADFGSHFVPEPALNQDAFPAHPD